MNDELGGIGYNIRYVTNRGRWLVERARHIRGRTRWVFLAAEKPFSSNGEEKPRIRVFSRARGFLDFMMGLIKKLNSLNSVGKEEGDVTDPGIDRRGKIYMRGFACN